MGVSCALRLFVNQQIIKSPAGDAGLVLAIVGGLAAVAVIKPYQGWPIWRHSRLTHNSLRFAVQVLPDRVTRHSTL